MTQTLRVPFIEVRVVQAVPLSDEEASVAAVHGWAAPRSGWHYTVALNTHDQLVTEVTGYATSQPEAEQRATEASRELLDTLAGLQVGAVVQRDLLFVLVHVGLLAATLAVVLVATLRMVP